MKNPMKGLRKVVALSILAMALVCGLLSTENATAQQGVWTHFCKTDEFEDYTWCKALSPKAETSYQRSDSKAAVECSNQRGSHPIAYFHFDYMNLAGSGPHFAKIRFDKDETDEVEVTTHDGGDVLFMVGWGRSKANFIRKLASKSTVLIGVDYYSDGLETFRYSLSGSEAAIQKAYEGCGLSWLSVSEETAKDELWSADRYNPDVLLSLECEENAESEHCSVVYDKDTYGVRDPLYICNKTFGTFNGYFPNDEGEKAFSIFIKHPLVVEAIARCDEE